MDEQTRYRVTGSLFLLALAIICLPMLFDGAGLPSRQLEPLVLDDTAATPAAASTEVPATEFVARIDELRDGVDADGFERASGNRFGEPVLSPIDADTSVWAVQVGSFADPENAENLRTQLRSDGYEAFITTVRSNGDERRRVAVGPLLDRQQAQSLLSELADRYHLDGPQLVAFSN
ncbi:MAG: SPOR domain-containing protein [Pseudomonadales bacterium]